MRREGFGRRGAGDALHARGDDRGAGAARKVDSGDEGREADDLQLAVEKIAKKQDADPLLFLGGDPDKTFHEWASLRLRYDGRFIGRGAKGEGVVRVRFYIEPDGKITIGEVIKSPDEKLSREMIRVIRSSKGKWTPRKVRGVPQRTAYEYGVNFLGMAE